MGRAKTHVGAVKRLVNAELLNNVTSLTPQPHALTKRKTSCLSTYRPMGTTLYGRLAMKQYYCTQGRGNEMENVRDDVI